MAYGIVENDFGFLLKESQSPACVPFRDRSAGQSNQLGFSAAVHFTTGVVRIDTAFKGKAGIQAFFCKLLDGV